MAETAPTFRRYQEGDEAGILPLFNRVFGAGRPDFRPRTLEEWRWKFLGNPAGTRIYVGLDEGGVIVSQYASVPSRVWIEGRTATFGQIVDSMVDPSHRSSLGKHALFRRTAEPFFDEFGGPDRDVVMYGVPIWSHYRVGHALLGYDIVRTETLLVREGAAPLFRAPAEIEVGEVPRFGKEADSVWERVRPELRAAVVRDGAHLDWRYSPSSGFTYRLGIARRGGEPSGLAVYRCAPFLLPRAGILCDWLVPAGEIEVARALLAWAFARAREDGAPAVGALIPDSSPWFVALQREGFLLAPIDYFMGARNFDARLDAEWLRSNWFYTLGDTDLL